MNSDPVRDAVNGMFGHSAFVELPCRPPGSQTARWLWQPALRRKERRPASAHWSWRSRPQPKSADVRHHEVRPELPWSTSDEVTDAIVDVRVVVLGIQRRKAGVRLEQHISDGRQERATFADQCSGVRIGPAAAGSEVTRAASESKPTPSNPKRHCDNRPVTRPPRSALLLQPATADPSRGNQQDADDDKGNGLLPVEAMEVVPVSATEGSTPPPSPPDPDPLDPDA